MKDTGIITQAPNFMVLGGFIHILGAEKSALFRFLRKH